MYKVINEEHILGRYRGVSLYVEEFNGCLPGKRQDRGWQ